MKSNFFNGRMLPKELLIPLFTSVTLVFLTLNTSCNKDRNTKDNSSPIDNSIETLTTSGTLQANLLGAIPNDGKDDTKAIQDAIDKAEANGGGTVSLSDGDYNINADTSIYLRSNVTLAMTGNATLIASPTSNERYAVIKAVNIHDARVLGGRIIGDRDNHLGTGGEHGFGINIKGSDHIRVVNTRISKCWGDGLIVGATSLGTSTNITIKGVWSRNNRRQAISVIQVDGLTIDSCYLYNTSGTAPEDGIDIEPDVTTTPGTAQNIAITHCNIYSNMGNGIEINERGDNIVKNVTMEYNTIYDHTQGFSGYFQNADYVTFSNNTMYGNKYNSPYHASCTNYVANNNTVQ